MAVVQYDGKEVSISFCRRSLTGTASSNIYTNGLKMCFLGHVAKEDGGGIPQCQCCFCSIHFKTNRFNVVYCRTQNRETIDERQNVICKECF
jgi:hypothetical protein